MNWKDLGEAISEAIAIKQKVSALADTIADCNAEIARNNQGIEIRKSLESQNEALENKKKSLVSEKESVEAELAKRMKKLDEAGVKLPDEAKSGGVVRV
jgi:DNA repair exonuclease SbcCD ATPase subunit